MREKYCWLIAGHWFVLREKYCWLVADKPRDQGARDHTVIASFYKVAGKRKTPTSPWCMHTAGQGFSLLPPDSDILRAV
jgi:hypothetical protein